MILKVFPKTNVPPKWSKGSECLAKQTKTEKLKGLSQGVSTSSVTYLENLPSTHMRKHVNSYEV